MYKIGAAMGFFIKRKYTTQLKVKPREHTHTHTTKSKTLGEPSPPPPPTHTPGCIQDGSTKQSALGLVPTS